MEFDAALLLSAIREAVPATDPRSLATLDGVELYSLQKGPGVEQLAGVRFPIIELGSRLDETGGAFMETAALMQALDAEIMPRSRAAAPYDRKSSVTNRPGA